MAFRPSYYSAQQMLTTYSTGQDVGDAYGVARSNPLPAIIPLIAAGMGLATTIAGKAGAQKEHECAMEALEAQVC